MKIQLKRSNVLEGSVAKQPSNDQMEYGEIAINYSQTDPAIFLKNANNDIIRIAGAGPKIGNLTGNVTGNLTGNVTGNLTGNVTGDLIGDVTGNLTGNVTGSLIGNADTSTSSQTFSVTANNNTNEIVYPVFVDGESGSQGAETDVGLAYNPGTGVLTSAGFAGNLTGNVTGSINLNSDLDIQTFSIITSQNNRDINLDPTGSGVVVVKGNATRGSGQLKLNCEYNSHGVNIKGPAHSAGSTYTLTLPTALPTVAGQSLVSDTSGLLSFTNIDSVSAGVGIEQVDNGDNTYNLAVKVKTSGAIEVDSTGIGITAAPGGGLAVSASGISIGGNWSNFATLPA